MIGLCLGLCQRKYNTPWVRFHQFIEWLSTLDLIATDALYASIICLDKVVCHNIIDLFSNHTVHSQGDYSWRIGWNVLVLNIVDFNNIFKVWNLIVVQCLRKTQIQQVLGVVDFTKVIVGIAKGKGLQLSFDCAIDILAQSFLWLFVVCNVLCHLTIGIYRADLCAHSHPLSILHIIIDKTPIFSIDHTFVPQDNARKTLILH